MAFWRKDIFKINGYNNNLKGWGYEDSELAARLINCNLEKRVMKNMGIVYHIYHEERCRERSNSNFTILQETVRCKIKIAINGINNFMDSQHEVP
jgi:predicted glycosyltransferase involved in capsule biosynthesis